MEENTSFYKVKQESQKDKRYVFLLRIRFENDLPTISIDINHLKE